MDHSIEKSDSMRSRRVLAVAVLMSSPVQSVEAQGQAPAEAVGVTQEGRLYRAAAASVFKIEAGLSHGTGFLIDSQGLIATNDHVLGISETVTVYLDSATRAAAAVVARDANADLALIRIAPSLLGSRSPLPLASHPVSVAPGDRVIALGYPLTQPLTITAGMIANVRSGGLLTDATINPGNSGGPLLTTDGIVVAINTFRDVDENAIGPGLGGAVLVDRLQELREASKGMATVLPSRRKFPVLPTTTYPVSALKMIADTVDPLLFAVSSSINSGPFEIAVSTPVSRMLTAVTVGRVVSKDRRNREKRAGIPDAQLYAPPGELRDWSAFIGDATVPVVGIKVTPLFGETSGSSFRRGFLTALVGAGGKATIRYQGDVRNVTLHRDGKLVEPLRGGHVPVPVAADNSLFDFTDVADFGYYVYPADVFRPNSPQRPPEIVIEIEDLKHPGTSRRERLPAITVARLWNDFEGFFRKEFPTRPFPAYALEKSCSVEGATAMLGVAPNSAGSEGSVCTYVVSVVPKK